MKRLISFRMLKKNCRYNPNGHCRYYCGSMSMSVQDKCTTKNCPIWKKLGPRNYRIFGKAVALQITKEPAVRGMTVTDPHTNKISEKEYDKFMKRWENGYAKRHKA